MKLQVRTMRPESASAVDNKRLFCGPKALAEGAGGPLVAARFRTSGWAVRTSSELRTAWKSRRTVARVSLRTDWC
jgi:hypothetical protein